MRVTDFEYHLPPELIARRPAAPRDSSRMMVVDSRTGEIRDSTFRQLLDFLNPSDVLVFNNTRVLKARLYGQLRPRSGKPRNVEVFFSRERSPGVWEVLCRPGRRVRLGDRVVLEGVLEAVFGATDDYGLWRLELDSSQPAEAVLERLGHVPLPPYINRPVTPRDAVEYQTVYANVAGAVAAPTAGLHFSDQTFRFLREHGLQVEMITLHVGIGTFMPIRTEDPRHHTLMPERFEITSDVARRLNLARDSGRRIVAIGTTTTRTLEYVVSRHGRFVAGSGEADLLILPGHTFHAVNAILTNFHLPGSSLIMLVAAFATRDRILEAYRKAVELRYRFYSYGDCMLLL
jgi:S-adenosylmethionine:tRNA ribosyltransferase-isomerase